MNKYLELIGKKKEYVANLNEKLKEILRTKTDLENEIVYLQSSISSTERRIEQLSKQQEEAYKRARTKVEMLMFLIISVFVIPALLAFHIPISSAIIAFVVLNVLNMAVTIPYLKYLTKHYQSLREQNKEEITQENATAEELQNSIQMNYQKRESNHKNRSKLTSEIEKEKREIEQIGNAILSVLSQHFEEEKLGLNTQVLDQYVEEKLAFNDTNTLEENMKRERTLNK